MEDMNEMRPCPFCGAEIRSDARKCRYCGHWLKKQCPNCGQWIALNARKCRFCGAWLDAGVDPGAAVVPARPEPPVQKVQVLEPEPYHPEPPRGQEWERPQEPQSHPRRSFYRADDYSADARGKGMSPLYFSLELLVPVIILICRYMRTMPAYMLLALLVACVGGVLVYYFRDVLARGLFSVLASTGWALLGLVIGPMCFDRQEWVPACELIAYNFYQYWWLGLFFYIAALAIHIPILSPRFKVA